MVGKVCSTASMFGKAFDKLFKPDYGELLKTAKNGISVFEKVSPKKTVFTSLKDGKVVKTIEKTLHSENCFKTVVRDFKNDKVTTIFHNLRPEAEGKYGEIIRKLSSYVQNLNDINANRANIKINDIDVYKNGLAHIKTSITDGFLNGSITEKLHKGNRIISSSKKSFVDGLKDLSK